MSFHLVKSLEGVQYYGYIPEAFGGPEGAFERWPLEQEDIALLNKDFVDSINDACGTLLDLADVEYFDADKCVKLRTWLRDRLQRDCDERLAVLYGKLLEFAEQAIALGTGVVVEL